MIERFLTPPRAAAEWAADGVRLLGLLGVVAALVWWAPGGIGAIVAGLVVSRVRLMTGPA